MSRYLTTSQFRVIDTGIVGTASNAGITDLALARFIAQAESDIDAYFGFAPYLNGGFEQHNTGLIQQGFDQRTRRLQAPTWPVPMRNTIRYRIHISNASPTGTGLFAAIDNGDAVFNQAAGYIEIVPLQAITYSLAPVVWDLGLEPPLIEAEFAVGFYIPVLGAPLYDDTGAHTTYRSLNSAWASSYDQAIANRPNTLPPVPPVIYKNGVAQVSGYSVNSAEGTVTFSPPLSSSDVVTADYTYTIPEWVRDAATVQTVALLSERQVAQAGALPYTLVKNGDQEVRRKETRNYSPLCDQALAIVDNYSNIGIA